MYDKHDILLKAVRKFVLPQRLCFFNLENRINIWKLFLKVDAKRINHKRSKILLISGSLSLKSIYLSIVLFHKIQINFALSS